MRKTVLVAAGAWLLVACGGGERTADSEGEVGGSVSIAVPDAPPAASEPTSVTAAPVIRPGDTVVTGIVRETGALPLTQLVIQASGTGVAPVAVRGSLKVEIQNLIGAEVRVWGSPTDNQPPTPPRAIEVSGYEVVSVGGDTPVVGTLVEEGGAFFLMSGAKVRLGSIPEALRAHIGAKIWVVGTQHDDALSVQSYGIIRH